MQRKTLLTVAIGAARRERLKAELSSLTKRLDLELLFYAHARASKNEPPRQR